MPSYLSIAPGISYCNADGRIIFLDLNRQRYFQLNEHQTCWFEALMSEGYADPATPEMHLARRLEHMGLLTESNGTSPAPCAPPQPRASLLDHPHNEERSLSLSDLPTVGWSVAGTFVALRLRGLRVVLNQHVQAKSNLVAGSASLDVRAWSLAARFMAWSPALFTSHDECLFRSLALARFLIVHRYHAEIVIGVRSQPFRAHCWVQAGDMVFNEHLEIARDYCPLLVC